MSDNSEYTVQEFLNFLKPYQVEFEKDFEKRFDKTATEQLPLKRYSATSKDFKSKNFLDALKKIIDDGSFANLISIHTRPSYRIHSTGRRPNHRFLPWHRVYLRIFELELNRVTGNILNITVPYWDWEKDSSIPDWILKYQVPPIKDVLRYDLPNGVPTPATINVKRFVGTTGGRMPRKSDVDNVMNKNNFEDFTNDLEKGPHNAVHNYIGGRDPRQGLGTMAEFTSPADPLFWLHHANIDRIWHKWQRDPKRPDNQNKHPYLPTNGGGEQSPKMDPWPYMEKDTRRIEAKPVLGYIYEEAVN
jgi:tyrosinase